MNSIWNGYPSLRAQSGFTLVEMMVGLVISLVGTLAMMTAFALFEAQKRTTTAGNDAQQNGSYSLYELEREVRTAGSGMIQGTSWGLSGCSLTHQGSLPLTGAPAPFNTFPVGVRAIPVVAVSGGVDGSGNALPDMIAVIGGNPGVQVFRNVVLTATATSATLDPNYSNTTGLLPNDYLIGVTAAGTCTVAPIATAVAPTSLTFSGTTPTGFSGTQYLFDMGPTPTMSIFAVSSGTGDVGLYRYGMLDQTSYAVADGVVLMRALYGVDDGANGGAADDFVIDEWVRPEGAWDYTKLMDGSANAQVLISRIKAVRIGVVAQTLLPEQATVAQPIPVVQTVPNLFADQPAALQSKIKVDNRYHHRIYDTTIPIRNEFIQKKY